MRTFNLFRPRNRLEEEVLGFDRKAMINLKGVTVVPLQIKVIQDVSQGHLGLGHGKVLSDTRPFAIAKGPKNMGRALTYRIGSKPIRIEAVRVIPPGLRMTMEGC